MAGKQINQAEVFRHTGKLQRILLRMLLLGTVALVLMACQQEETVLPTVIPTFTEIPASPTATLTPTVTPTRLPSATPLPRPATTADNPVDQAFIRVVHAMPTAAPIDVYIEGRGIAFNLNYQAATSRNGIVPGEYILRIFERGGVPIEDTPQIEQTLTIDGGDALLLLYTGALNTPTLTIFPETNEPLDGGQARVSVIHAIPRGPGLTMQQNGEDLIAPIEFGQRSDLLNIPAGDTTLTFQSGPRTLATFTQTLIERNDYTLLVTGDSEDLENARIIRINERAPGRADYRVINASNRILDLYLDDTALAQNIPVRQVSQRQTIISQRYTVSVFDAGADPSIATPLASLLTNISPDEIGSLIVTGTDDNLEIVQYDENTQPTNPEEARVTFLNALPNVAAMQIDYSQDSETPLVAALRYGTTSLPITIPTGVYDFFAYEVEGIELGATVESSQSINIQGGVDYLYIVTGRDIEQPPLLLSQEVGTSLVFNLEDDSFTTSDPIIRIVNVVSSGERLDVQVDDQPITSALTFGDVSEPYQTTEGTRTLGIRQPGGTFDVSILTLDFNRDLFYTVYIYGESLSDIEVITTSTVIDSFEDANFADIRLINVSTDMGISFQLGYRAFDANATLPVADPTTAADIGDFRDVIPPGITRSGNPITSGNASFTGLIPVGQQDIFIIDRDERLLASTLRGIPITAGTIYDVIAFQDRDSELVTSFIVSYPAP